MKTQVFTGADAPAMPVRGPFASSVYAEEDLVPAPDPIALLRAELRGEIRSIKANLGRPPSNPSTDVAVEMSAIRESLEQIVGKSDRSAALVRAHGIEGGAALALARATRAKGDDAAGLDERFRNALSELVELKAWPLSCEGRAVVAAVGPAGVGKTTTIAKLAARARMEDKSVTLVTCDTFRVGGAEQIERYAELLGVPCAMAHDAHELGSIISSARTQFVFVDTAGREPGVNATERVLAADAFAVDDGLRGFSRHVLLCIPATRGRRGADGPSLFDDEPDGPGDDQDGRDGLALRAGPRRVCVQAAHFDPVLRPARPRGRLPGDDGCGTRRSHTPA